MDLIDRIRRRQRDHTADRLGRDYAPLSSATHVTEPDGRGLLLERLLDLLDPVFDGGLPTNAYV
jgi:hypothetical protein